jgi:citrate synthase
MPMPLQASAIQSATAIPYPAFPPLEALVAAVLGVPLDAVTENLTYRDIAEWDSIGHVNLMLEIERTYSIKINSELVSQLTSLRALKAFVDQLANDAKRTVEASANLNTAKVDGGATVHRGLAGVCFDRSAITNIDAAGSALWYRGYAVDELASKGSFEEAAFLLIYGRLPDHCELAAFSDTLRFSRAVPSSVVSVLAGLAMAPPFLALQVAVAALGAISSQSVDADITVIAQLPTLLGAFHRLRTGSPPVSPRGDLGHAENFLYMLDGKRPSVERAKALDEVFVMLADHGSSASTFTARVVASTNADVHATLASAIGAFSGPLHGGAIDRVVAMAEEIGSPTAAAAFVQERIKRNDVIFGFGHRVYRSADPRSHRLRALARQLGSDKANKRILDILEAIASALSDYARLGLDVNVDFYASAVFEALQIPRDLFGPVFVTARMAGLVAHCREQRSNNVLIRPQLRYDGEPARKYESRALSHE